MKAGDYVRCNFPFREVRGPGPSPHIVLVLGLDNVGGDPFAMVAYTTTQTRFQGTQRPFQHLLVDENHARALGQNKSFVIDVSRIARLPLNTDFFPDIRDGVIPNLGQDPACVDRVIQRIRELGRSGYKIAPVDLSTRSRPKHGL